MNTQLHAVDRLGDLMGDAISRGMIRLILASGVPSAAVDVDRLSEAGKRAWAEAEDQVWAGWEAAANAVVSDEALRQFVGAQAFTVASRAVELYHAQ